MELLNDIKNYTPTLSEDVKVWYKAARVSDFPENGGACLRYKEHQEPVYVSYTSIGVNVRYQEFCVLRPSATVAAYIKIPAFFSCDHTEVF